MKIKSLCLGVSLLANASSHAATADKVKATLESSGDRHTSILSLYTPSGNVFYNHYISHRRAKADRIVAQSDQAIAIDTDMGILFLEYSDALERAIKLENEGEYPVWDGNELSVRFEVYEPIGKLKEIVFDENYAIYYTANDVRLVEIGAGDVWVRYGNRKMDLHALIYSSFEGRDLYIEKRNGDLEPRAIQKIELDRAQKSGVRYLNVHLKGTKKYLRIKMLPDEDLDPDDEEYLYSRAEIEIVKGS